MHRWPVECRALILIVAGACGRTTELGHDFAHAADAAAGGSVPITDAQASSIQACTSAQQCYPDLDAATLNGGAAVCMTQFINGYCTHPCTTDADCCAIAGECPSGYPEVCAPFESTGETYCFISCEDSDASATHLPDSTTFCQDYSNRSFICRSTGGGSQNRKVCLPNG